MAIRPPTSTRTYRSIGKNQDEEHFDPEYYASKFCNTQDDCDALWLATVAYRLYNPKVGKRSVFPSACDILDLHLGYDAVDEEPVWESNDDRKRSIVGLFAVQRLANLLAKEIATNRDDYLVCSERVTCPLCDNETIDVQLGHKLEFNSAHGRIETTDEIVMIGATVYCKCQSFGVSDMLAIEDSAIESVFEDFNA